MWTCIHAHSTCVHACMPMTHVDMHAHNAYCMHCRHVSSDQELPLHLVLRHNHGDSALMIVIMLLEAFPEAASVCVCVCVCLCCVNESMYTFVFACTHVRLCVKHYMCVRVCTREACTCKPFAFELAGKETEPSWFPVRRRLDYICNFPKRLR
jgi:hypothetical protein